MSVALFIIGEPGVGKTTAIRELVPALKPNTTYEGIDVVEVVKPKWTIVTTYAPKIEGDIVLAGHYRGETFDGADTVPYTGAKDALAYWDTYLRPTAELTIFDGDRFSTQPSLDFVRSTGVRVVGVHLFVPAELATERRAQRGSNQNETWLKGRITKARNFAEKIGAFHILADESPVLVAERIGSCLRLAEAA